MKPWLQLFRAPNLFTVPGDPLAGYLIASGAAATLSPSLAAIMLASLFLYACGLVLNDLMDYREDLRDRPKRPLPSGAISKISAIIAAVLLATAALALAWLARHWLTPEKISTYKVLLKLTKLPPYPAIPEVFPCACVLLLAIVTYNCGVKKIPVVGAINMGFCRGLNVLLGATLAAASWKSAIPAALAITAYITAVTLLARNETRNPAIPPLIGVAIRGLILIQALLCAFSGTGYLGWICAAILALALWPLSRIVGGRFYGS